MNFSNCEHFILYTPFGELLKLNNSIVVYFSYNKGSLGSKIAHIFNILFSLCI